MNSLWLGGTCGTTQTWWSTRQREIVRLANLPKPTKTMLEWTVDQNEQYCRENHNACFLTVTNKPYYGLLSCKNIAKEKTIQAYYGPASGFLLGQYVNEQFYVELLSSLRGPATSCSKCLLSTWSSFLILTCSKNQTSILIMTARLLILTFGRNFESYTLLGKAVPVAFLEKHWCRSNNKTAVFKPWVRNKLVLRRSSR